MRGFFPPGNGKMRIKVCTLDCIWGAPPWISIENLDGNFETATNLSPVLKVFLQGGWVVWCSGVQVGGLQGIKFLSTFEDSAEHATQCLHCFRSFTVLTPGLQVPWFPLPPFDPTLRFPHSVIARPALCVSSSTLF